LGIIPNHSPLKKSTLSIIPNHSPLKKAPESSFLIRSPLQKKHLGYRSEPFTISKRKDTVLRLGTPSKHQ
jgi:hypothetical protein